MPENWESKAACRNVDDPSIFFPEDFKGRNATKRLKQAKAYCDRCQVREQCRIVGLRFDVGIFGGETHQERMATELEKFDAAQS